jgi:anti-sigma factor ChrR (cupin superfamily)
MARFVVKKETEGVWIPDPFMKLPKGATVKVLRHDRKAGILDMLIKRPEGYVEPRHTHSSFHSIVVLEGRVNVAGKELKAGGYIYGPPGVPHGPFEWHDGCVVFAHFEGDPIHHYKKP